MKGILAGLGAGLVACAMFAGASVAYAEPAPPGPGNSVAAHECQHGGWQNLYTSTYAPFDSEGSCVAYAAHGGVLMPKPTYTYTVTQYSYDPTVPNCSWEVDFTGFAPNTAYTVLEQFADGRTYYISAPSDSLGSLAVIGIDTVGQTWTETVLNPNGQAVFTTAPITAVC